MTDEILESFDGTRKAGSIAAEALDEVSEIIKPGVTTEKIDKLCYEFIVIHYFFKLSAFSIKF